MMTLLGADGITDKKIFVCSVVLTSILFGLNYFHQAEQGGIFYGRYIPLSESIQQLTYRYPGHESSATYPVWGYPLLMAVVSPIARSSQGIYFFQYALLLTSFALVYRSFALPQPREPLKLILFYGVLVSYAMVLSVKWPMAIASFLLLTFALLHEKRRYGLASLVLLAAMHFRSEALVLWGVYLLFLLIQGRRKVAQGQEGPQKRRVNFKLAVTVLGSVILLSCWPLYQYSQHRVFLMSATNSGGVLYLSLGQLPNNPWDRIMLDRVATDYARSRGVQDAWGVDGNRVLTRRFLNDIQAHPMAFLAKVLYNEVQILKGGFYVSELRHLSVRRDPLKDQEQRALFEQYQDNTSSLFRDVLALKAHTWTMLAQLSLAELSSLLLLGLLGYLLLLLVRRERSVVDPYLWIVAGQFLLVGLVQYQSRHVSVIAILFLFLLYRRDPAAERQ